jgi:acyl dehydratase
MDASAVGKTGQPVTMRVELGKVREFARAIKDDNPIYLDEEYARREAGGIIAPPTFLMTLGFWDDGRGRPKLDMDLRRVLHGEQEFEYLAPIHAGDSLTAVSKVEKVFEKQGSRGGTMTFAVTATEFRNQDGVLVAVSRSTVIETGQVVKKD